MLKWVLTLSHCCCVGSHGIGLGQLLIGMLLTCRILRKAIGPPAYSIKYLVRSAFSTEIAVPLVVDITTALEQTCAHNEVQERTTSSTADSSSEADSSTHNDLNSIAPNSPRYSYTPADTVKVWYDSSKKKLAQIVPVNKHTRGPQYGYTGEWKDGFPHGFGRLSSSTETHIGQFEHGRRSGHGLKMLTDVFFYNGTYLSNQPSGFGLLYTTISTYKGEFLGGLRDGWGSLEVAVGIRTNNGEGWSGKGYRQKQRIKLTKEKARALMQAAKAERKADDPQEALGMENYTAADVLKLHHQRHAGGFARCHRYDGEWSHGERHGLGTLRWNSGASYTGYWEEGQCSGRGTYVASTGAVIDGTWLQDRLSAQHPCVISLPCGTQYMGRLQVREPLSTWLPTKFNPFELIQGTGSIHFANGTVFRGEIMNGKKHGKGILVDSNDVILWEGVWENGRAVKSPAQGQKSARMGRGDRSS